MTGRTALALLIALITVPPRLSAQEGGADSLSIHESGRHGTPVVIVPGVLGSAYSFRKVIPDLVADDFRVAVIDPLGFGASARPDGADYSFTAQAARLSESIRKLGFEKVILVCHALSGPICLRLAYHHPEQVASLISINGGVSEQAGTAQMRLSLKLARVVLFVMGKDFALKHLRKGLIQASGDTTWLTDAVLANYVAPFGPDVRTVVRSLQQIVNAHEPEALAPNLPRIQAPVRLVYGTVARNPDDPPVGNDELAVMRKTLRRFQLDPVAGAGVYIQEEQPGRIVAAIKQMRDRSLTGD